MFNRAYVVRGNIEESACVEVEAIDPVYFISLGGNLHNKVFHAVIGCFTHKAEKVKRLRRCQIRFHKSMPVGTVVHRRQERSLTLGISVKYGMGEICGSCFAFSTRDPNNREPAGRISEKSG